VISFSVGLNPKSDQVRT